MHVQVGGFDPRDPLLTPAWGLLADALDLLARHPGCLLDTTMVGTPFTEAFAPLPPDWAARLVDVADRVVFGSDFPNIPYAYAEQVRAVASWAAADDRLGVPFLRSVLYDAPDRLLGLSG